ncbi:hypothetical protein ZIOFF_002891 [Zingiber officinale]|uniref:H(+)-exporting diphosphatase n=1 Tax=Zingiber officinale TaxID=94328 RepID=A0A8J5LT17_ZINOF|nr:hypothetical protein ZIOFF_002891 [Zingiber officinale]
MSSIPLIAVAGAAVSLLIFKSSNSGQKAYAQASTMVEHTVGSIITFIIEKGYDGRTIFNVMIVVTIGGMCLGQASPCLSSFASGQAATYQMFEIINQIPSIDVYDTSDILLEEIKGDELKDVHFSYPSRFEQLIFDGFSMCISSAQKDDDTPPIEAILAPLEAELKLARQELPYGHLDTDLYNACYDLISFEQTVPCYSNFRP